MLSISHWGMFFVEDAYEISKPSTEEIMQNFDEMIALPLIRETRWPLGIRFAALANPNAAHDVIPGPEMDE